MVEGMKLIVFVFLVVGQICPKKKAGMVVYNIMAKNCTPNFHSKKVEKLLILLDISINISESYLSKKHTPNYV